MLKQNLYREIRPLGGAGDNDPVRLKGKGYIQTRATVYLLAYKDQVALDNDMLEHSGLYEELPPPEPKFTEKLTDEFEVTGYRIRFVGPRSPTKAIPMGTPEKKNVTQEKDEQDWRTQVDDFYRRKTVLPDIWRSLQITYAGRAPQIFDSRQLEDLVLMDDVLLSTPDIKFDLGTTADSFNRTINVPGQWAPLRMIIRDDTRWDSNKKMWIVPYQVKDMSGYQRTLWLGVKTSTVIPPREEWPVIESTKTQDHVDPAQGAAPSATSANTEPAAAKPAQATSTDEA
ncbi:MAG: hypothetical protein ACQKBV_09665 [Puniceicoccales bacterium]